MTRTKAAKAAGPNRARSREDWALWLSFLAPIGAWIAAQQLGFLLSPWVCDTGRRWVLYVVMAAAFGVAAAGMAASAREALRRRPEEGDDDPVTSRRRFMAFGALASSALFLVAIVALAIPVFVHRPCD